MNISDLMNGSAGGGSGGSGGGGNDERKSRPSQPPPVKGIDVERDQRRRPSQAYTPPLRQHNSFPQLRATPSGHSHAPDGFARPPLEPTRSGGVPVNYSQHTPTQTPSHTTPGPVYYPPGSPRYGPPPPASTHSQSPVQGHVHGHGYQTRFPHAPPPPASLSRYPSSGSPVVYAAHQFPAPQYPPRYDQRAASAAAAAAAAVHSPNAFQHQREQTHRPPDIQASRPPYASYSHPDTQPSTPLGPPVPRSGSSIHTYSPRDSYATATRHQHAHPPPPPASSTHSGGPTGPPRDSPRLHLIERQHPSNVQRTRNSPSLSPKSVPAYPSYSQSTSRNPSFDHHAQRPSPRPPRPDGRPPSSHPDLAARPTSQSYGHDVSPRPRQHYNSGDPQSISSILSRPSESPRAPTADDRPRASPASRQITAESPSRAAVSPPPPLVPRARPAPPSPASQTAPALVQKRPADEAVEAPSDRKKARRKYDRPPVWARLAPRNPNYNAALHRPDGPTDAADAAPTHARPPTAQNGHPVALRDTRLLEQKVRASELLGTPWELSVTDVVPSDEILTQVATFLYRGVLQHPELDGKQSGPGSLEIEAKLGHFERRGETGRLRLPVTSTAVLDPAYARDQLQFVSNMDLEQHKHMNLYLNELVRESSNPDRVPISFIHRRELDSFRTLSQKGRDLLPPFPASEVNPNHTLKLRTTHDVDPQARPRDAKGNGPVIARIVKRRLHDLSIYSPATDYDLRISINVEVDLMHHETASELDPETLSVPAGDEKSRQPDRYKDRLSYSHCAYSIDLTQVTVDGTRDLGSATHELEVEVDAIRLRDQARMLRDGRANAFEALVQGLLSNCFLLMRVRPS